MLEQIKNYYENYDEDSRLIRDKAHLPEYLTSVRYFNKLFVTNCSILDACAGTGRYSFYLADEGHLVTACDLVEHNVEIIKKNPNSYRLAKIDICNVLDLSRFPNDAFDLVLCMGALYHLTSEEEKTQAIKECVRVCKAGGIVVLAYLSKIGAIFLRMQSGLENIGTVLEILDNNEKGIFRCAFSRDIDSYAKSNGLDRICNIGTDGVSQLLKDRINDATDEEFEKYMEYMYRTCEDESILGTSLHCLYFGRKTIGNLDEQA